MRLVASSGIESRRNIEAIQGQVDEIKSRLGDANPAELREVSPALVSL
jgi:hypothetical protein